ncbi:MAG: helix-turn-helix domain-containing protein [Rhodocyclaceae bacterium]
MLPFAEGELLAVRLLPAEFARALNVSKQTVSRWIHTDKVTLGCDGRLNPKQAMSQLLRNGDPGRMRTRLVRQAFADMGDLRAHAARVDELEQQMSDATARLLHLEAYAAESLVANEIAIDLLVEHLGEIRTAPDEAALRELLDDLFVRALVLAPDRIAQRDHIDLANFDFESAPAAEEEETEEGLRASGENEGGRGTRDEF